MSTARSVYRPERRGKSRPAEKGDMVIEHTTSGTMSLAELAAQHKTVPSSILRLTAEHSPQGAYPANVAAYINGVFEGKVTPDQHMPAGLHLYLPS
jgi:hypothetical protein